MIYEFSFDLFDKNFTNINLKISNNFYINSSNLTQLINANRTNDNK